MEKKFVRYCLDTFESLPERAKELLFEEDGINELILNEIENYLLNVESPIEKILITALIIFLTRHSPVLYFETQKEIKVENHKYYADIYIEYDEMVNYYLNKKFKLIIECDGFDYHHSNKKQVEHDYIRENELKVNGYDIIRFTGSQIYKDPMECTKKIIKYIKAKGVVKKDEESSSTMVS